MLQAELQSEPDDAAEAAELAQEGSGDDGQDVRPGQDEEASEDDPGSLAVQPPRRTKRVFFLW